MNLQKFVQYSDWSNEIVKIWSNVHFTHLILANYPTPLYALATNFGCQTTPTTCHSHLESLKPLLYDFPNK